MIHFEPSDPAYASKVRDSFSRQAFMGYIGAELTAVSPGLVEIELPFRNELTQQHHFFHGGVIGTLADNVCGYAAYSMTPPNTTVLTVEYKLNFIAPGEGERLIAQGQVLKPGRTLIVCEAKVFAVKNGHRKQCATALVTIMNLKGRADNPEQQNEAKQ